MGLRESATAYLNTALDLAVEVEHNEVSEHTVIDEDIELWNLMSDLVQEVVGKDTPIDLDDSSFEDLMDDCRSAIDELLEDAKGFQRRITVDEIIVTVRNTLTQSDSRCLPEFVKQILRELKE